MLKKKIVFVFSTVSLIMLSTLFVSAGKQDNSITKEDGMYVVNTTDLGKNIIGYESTTPLKIYIKRNKIIKIEALRNMETPKYFLKVKKSLLNQWDNLKIDEALKKDVDCVTGATYSSKAVIDNVQVGLNHYKMHK